MSKRQSKEKVNLWEMPALFSPSAESDLSAGIGSCGSIQLMQAQYQQQVFSKHSHEGFGIGVIEKGALEFFYRGENLVASQGLVNLVNPDEIHNGQSATETGWQYRMFYFDALVLQDLAQQMGGGHDLIPFFKMGVIQDKVLADSLYGLHSMSEKIKHRQTTQQSGKHINHGALSVLELQTRFMALLEYLVKRYSDKSITEHEIMADHRAIEQVIDYIREYANTALSITQLARVAHLSPYHFIRLFKRQVGMSPHAYLMQTRVFQAKEMIRKKSTLAEVALSCGFTDQSHMSRHFKRVLGYTPGVYRSALGNVFLS